MDISWRLHDDPRVARARDAIPVGRVSQALQPPSPIDAPKLRGTNEEHGAWSPAVALDPERYVIGDDGLLVEKVGRWAKDKLEIVGNYVQISGATRRKYRENQPSFIDVFCGPSRSLIRSTGE